MKKSLLIFICVGIAFFSAVFNCCRPTGYSAKAMSAAGMITIDANSGRVLYESNSHKKLPMASTTKIVTAITVIENCDLNDMVKVDDKAVGVEGSSIYLQKGEELSVRDLLYGLMLQSGNDCAVALAIHCAGSIENFAAMMNDEAEKIGAVESNFVTPHGLHHDDHYTTASDLAKISAYAMKNDEFKQIVATKTYRMPYAGHDYDRVISNKNKILFNYPGGNGIKTGYTKKAGRCLVASATRSGMTVISVVLNCGPMFEECSALMDRAFAEYENVTLLDNTREVARAYVKNGKENYVPLYAKNTFRYPLTQSEKARISIAVDCKEMTAPVKKDEIAGKISIYLDNRLLFEENLFTITEVGEISVIDKIKELLDEWTP